MAFAGKAALMAVGISTLAACAVGPDYQRPDAVMSDHYKEQSAASSELWRPSRPGDEADRGAWWSVYGDPLLNSLLSQVDVSNQNVKAYEAAYRQALAVADAARASFFPTLSLDASGARSQSHASVRGSSGTSVLSNSYSTSLSASWEPDLWGRIRRTVEGNEASAEASSADLAAARLSAQGTLAADYFSLRYEDALKHLLEATATAYQRSLEITRNQYGAGMASRSDVVQAEAQLASTQSQLVAVGSQRAQLEHAIAVLVGKAPADFSIADTGVLSEVPPIPAGVPSVLLERRPDIAASERRMAAANAQIGVAVAAYFPSLTLSGSNGFSASTLGSLLQASNNVWSVGPSLALTVFDAGSRSAQVEEARASYDQSVANYRQSVLTAMQAVEDNLATLRILAEQAEVQNKAVLAATEAERLVLNQYRAGTVAYTSVVTAQATALSDKQTALGIAQSRLSASVALIQALGGGWERRPTADAVE
ncbi:efflux transporter outer membrane subunit [Telmatospirillum sp.]|uniref:efflux transporter outer membrane subunit n=1 Tax=Telmatospirillum sp. TaxID=2079197 RepID=UPI00283E66CC|nr:efflux transporter outer membrane subunit [Telmatospirillum sp.]MDR3437612.1 efflux transporter outer membrane subunit [Telmatospirillum sp.]